MEASPVLSSIIRPLSQKRLSLIFIFSVMKIDGIIYAIDIKSRMYPGKNDDSCNEFLKIRNIRLTRTRKTNLRIQYNQVRLREHLQSRQVTIHKTVCPELNFPLEVIRVY